MSQQPASPATPSTQTTRLLACGIVAGPLFLAVVLLQAVTRQGFDLGRHPISLLSLGELRWIQITDFMVTGSLIVVLGQVAEAAAGLDVDGPAAPAHLAAVGLPARRTGQRRLARRDGRARRTRLHPDREGPGPFRAEL
jgi:hypothetical protein